MSHIITIVQARVGSSRLPGKVIMKILGKTVLELQLERMQRSSKCGKIVVATSNSSADNVIEELGCKLVRDVFRGDELDLLDRHFQCALNTMQILLQKCHRTVL